MRTSCPPQICEKCGLACGGCEWSDNLKPVPGWEIVPGDQSIVISKCPKFVRGTRDDKRVKGFTNEGTLRIAEAALKLLRDDYVGGSAEGRIAIERELRSKECAKLFQLSDPEGVIRGLRGLLKIRGRRVF